MRKIGHRIVIPEVMAANAKEFLFLPCSQNVVIECRVEALRDVGHVALHFVNLLVAAIHLALFPLGFFPERFVRFLSARHMPYTCVGPFSFLAVR